MAFSFKEYKQLNEQRASLNITMPLQEVINAGKVTNTVQIVIMAQLLGALKHFTGGAAARYMNEVALSGTSAALIKSLKEMKAEDQVHLARELLGQISNEYSITSDCCVHNNAAVSNIQK